MAGDGATRVTLSTLPTALIEELHDTLTLKPADDSQRIAQTEMLRRSKRRWMRDVNASLSANLLSAGKMGRDSLQGLCT